MTLAGLGFPVLALVALLMRERLERRLGANPRQVEPRPSAAPGGTPGRV